MTADGVLSGDPATLALLAREGVRTVADVLARSESDGAIQNHDIQPIRAA